MRHVTANSINLGYSFVTYKSLSQVTRTKSEFANYYDNRVVLSGSMMIKRNDSDKSFFFFFTQKRFNKFTVFKDQPDNRRKEKTSYPNIEDRKRDLESRVN